MRRTAFSGLGTRLYLGSSALVFQRMRQKVSQPPLWMTLFDIDPNVVTALIEYYSNENASPAFVGFDGFQPHLGDGLRQLWSSMDEARHLIVKGSSYEWFDSVCRPTDEYSPSLVFIDPHRLGEEREAIQSILATCQEAGSRFLCWTPLMCIPQKGLPVDAWSWSHFPQEDDGMFVEWCKEMDLRLAWFAWRSMSGGRQTSYGCQLTFDTSYPIQRLHERCDEMRIWLNKAGIHTTDGSFRVQCWPDMN